MGKTVEGLSVTIHMPKIVLSANLIATQGSYTYDLATKVTSLITLIISLYSFIEHTQYFNVFYIHWYVLYYVIGFIIPRTFW